MLRGTVICIVSISLACAEHFYFDSFVQDTKDSNVERFNAGTYQYMFSHQPTSWYEANVICKSYNATLATVDISQVLSSTLTRSLVPLEDAWIGGKRGNKEWNWLNGRRVARFAPRNNQPGQDCLAVERKDNKAALGNHECSNRKRFICQKDLLSSLADLEAPRPSPKIMYRGREFVLYTNQLSFYAAAAFCALKGDRLAVVDQQEIAKKISELMIINRPKYTFGRKLQGTEKTWTSGYYFDGAWRWLSTGQTITNIDSSGLRLHYYAKFKLRVEESDSCLLMRENAHDTPTYSINQCSKRHSFVCEKVSQQPKPAIRKAAKKGQFVIVEEKFPWQDAKKYCNSFGGHLSEGHDAQTLQKIADEMNNHFPNVSSVWLGAQFIKQAWIWEERATPMKTENDGLPLCQCNDALHNTCLSLGKTGNGKFLLHGLPCDYAQMSVCSDILLQ